MKRKILYKSIDPYYSDTTQTFIGESEESLDNQQYEFEQFLGQHHPARISLIYRKEILE